MIFGALIGDSTKPQEWNVKGNQAIVLYKGKSVLGPCGERTQGAAEEFALDSTTFVFLSLPWSSTLHIKALVSSSLKCRVTGTQ